MGVRYERAGVLFIGNSHFETEILRNARVNFDRYVNLRLFFGMSENSRRFALHIPPKSAYI